MSKNDYLHVTQLAVVEFFGYRPSHPILSHTIPFSYHPIGEICTPTTWVPSDTSPSGLRVVSTMIRDSTERAMLASAGGKENDGLLRDKRELERWLPVIEASLPLRYHLHLLGSTIPPDVPYASRTIQDFLRLDDALQCVLQTLSAPIEDRSLYTAEALRGVRGSAADALHKAVKERKQELAFAKLLKGMGKGE